MSDVTFSSADLTTFTRLDELGLEVTGQLLEPHRAVLVCRVVEPDEWCRRCGCQGVPRDTVTWRLAHEPFCWRPTVLLVRLCRYRCTDCGHVWRQNMTNTAVLAEGRRVLITDPARFDGVGVIGVDEHVVRHEALLIWMEVKDLHRFAVVAAG